APLPRGAAAAVEQHLAGAIDVAQLLHRERLQGIAPVLVRMESRRLLAVRGANLLLARPGPNAQDFVGVELGAGHRRVLAFSPPGGSLTAVRPAPAPWRGAACSACPCPRSAAAPTKPARAGWAGAPRRRASRRARS